MLSRHSLKLAFRYLGRHKGYSLINILGLAIGIASCLLIMLFVRSEWSFDRFHTKGDRIYRAWLEEHYKGEVFENTRTPFALVPTLLAGLPEVEKACRLQQLQLPVQVGNNRFNESVSMADGSFFSVFDFSLQAGSVQAFEAGGPVAVLTASMARKLFGNGPALGKIVQLQLDESLMPFTVVAVASDPPVESSIGFGLLIPFSAARHIWDAPTLTQAWSVVSPQSFFLLRKSADATGLQARIAQVLDPLVAKNYKPGEYLVRFQPLHDVHFNSTLPSTLPGDSNPQYASILSTVGLLILLIACINFVTLAVGRSSSRAREVGVHKVLGAERSRLVRQFCNEALLLAVLALLTGLGLTLLFLKPFSVLANRELFLVPDGFNSLFCLLLLAVISLGAGLYPALVLSGFRPIQVLKGRLASGPTHGLFRRALIVGQFTASIALVICTITVGRQLSYLQEKQLGYQKEHLVSVPTNLPRREGNVLAARLQQIVQQNPRVLQTTVSLYSMAEEGWMQLGYQDHQQVFRQFYFNAVDAGFIPAMGIQVVEGRAFQPGNAADSNAIVVNEALVKEYGWKQPLGMRLPGNYPQRVIGVVKDFHFDNLRNPIGPLVLALRPDSFFRHSSDVTYKVVPRPRLTVRFRDSDPAALVAFLKSSWKAAEGIGDFDCRFLDEALAAAYRQEERLGKMVRYASLLSIFIACMGLFGLATLVVNRRTKEIGIRKVLGADVPRIVALLSREFIGLVLVASLLAFPVAGWVMQRWLEDFAYRIPLPLLAFGAAALLALVVALLTVSIQTLRAALMNPVRSLRSE